METIKKNPVQEEVKLVDLTADQITALTAQIIEQTGRTVRLERCGYTAKHRRAAAALAKTAGDHLNLLTASLDQAREHLARMIEIGGDATLARGQFLRVLTEIRTETERKLLLDLQAMGVRPAWFQRGSRLEKYIEKSAAYAKRCADRRQIKMEAA
jgi:hypothetical protein